MKIEREVEQFPDRIADAQTPSVIAAYENRIRKLEEQQIVVAEKIASCGRTLPAHKDLAVPSPRAYGPLPGGRRDLRFGLVEHGDAIFKNRASQRPAYDSRKD